MLSSIIDDIRTDEDREFKTNKNGYIFTSSINYPNNKSLVKQNVYITSNGKITKVEVVDKDNNAQIIMNFNKQEYNKKFDKTYFELNSLLKMNQNNSKNEEKKSEENNSSNDTANDTAASNNNSNTTTSNNNTSNNNNNTNQSTASNTTVEEEKTEESNTKNTASINDVVYPMHLPNNTYLTSQEKINTKDGERLILTFSGDSDFILVEETSKIADENVVIPTNGEFDFLTDVIGIINSHSLSWNSNGIDYYIASKTIETAELIDIARSISVLPVSK